MHTGTTSDIINRLSANNIEFIDFGCSQGGSIKFAKKHFDAINGLGIDIDPVKVEMTRSLGFDAEVADLTKFQGLGKQVRFSIMSHFLEHLPSIELTKSCLLSAISISEEFIYIQQPYFDSDGYLFRNGLKLFWSDWSGHPNRMTSLEFHNLLSPLLSNGVISRFAIYGCNPIVNSHDKIVHPISSPINQHQWEKETHEKKPIIEFSEPVFRELKVLIGLKDGFNFDLHEEMFKWQIKLMDSDTVVTQ